MTQIPLRNFPVPVRTPHLSKPRRSVGSSGVLLFRAPTYRLVLFSLLIFLSLTGGGKLANGQQADLILFNGNVVTVDKKNSIVEAVAVADGKIVSVGSTADVKKMAGKKTRRIDLQGRSLVPGFVESHAHLTGIGQQLVNLDLTRARSWEDIVVQVQAAAKKAKPGEWILGRGWHQSLWNEKPVPNFDGYPIHDKLSGVSPDNPVLLTHRSGHMSFANRKAMDVAGISLGTVPPKGGEIPRDKQGEAIGVFRETAQALISRALAKSRSGMTAAERTTEFKRYVELAQNECLRFGVTTFCDAGMPPIAVRRLKSLVDRDQLKMRLWVMLRTANATLTREAPELSKIRHYGGDRLHVGGIKQMLDGALGAHGAWLLKPYSDLPESTGLVLTPVETIRKTAEIALRNDLQLCVHAIGDRANREMLDLFEEFGKQAGDRKLRWRIEHAQHLHPDDIARFAELNVIASMQGIHCTSDGPFVPLRLGEKRSEEGAYVWQSLLASGAVVANGSDAPVEPVDPILGFYASVTRKMKNGKVFYGGQKMTRLQALRSYTRDAAYAIRQEKNRGSLEVGKWADMVVLSHDILTVPDEEIRNAKVTHTFVGGDLVYEAAKSK